MLGSALDCLDFCKHANEPNGLPHLPDSVHSLSQHRCPFCVSWIIPTSSPWSGSAWDPNRWCCWSTPSWVHWGRYTRTTSSPTSWNTGLLFRCELGNLNTVCVREREREEPDKGGVVPLAHGTCSMAGACLCGASVVCKLNGNWCYSLKPLLY